MQVLVTGGAGNIGSHGHRTIDEGALQVPLIVPDLADRPAVEQLLRDHAIKAMQHFVACTDVGESVSDFSRYDANIAAGRLDLLNALVASGADPAADLGETAGLATPPPASFTLPMLRSALPGLRSAALEPFAGISMSGASGRGRALRAPALSAGGSLRLNPPAPGCTADSFVVYCTN